MSSAKFRLESKRHLLMPLLAAIASATSAIGAVPGSTSAVNVDARGIALAGYDPVAYFDKHQPTHGKEAISASYNGARYLFASEAHRKAFLTHPTVYVPQFGGFCAVGTSFGQKVDADPETGTVVSGKLYVNNNAKAQAVFDTDVEGTIARAKHNWPAVRHKPFEPPRTASAQP